MTQNLLRRASFPRGSRIALLFVPVLILAACSGASPMSMLLTCSCPAVDSPVCGADGITYENSCNAQCAGTLVAQAGHCGSNTGPCSCPATSDPVCGSNGVTYENACSATCAHQAIARAGVCTNTPDAGPPPPDASGSDGGSGPGDCASDSCGQDQVCVNDGCPGEGCTSPGEGNACAPGYTYLATGSCGPVSTPGGVCYRGCTALTDTHHCVNVSPSCSPATCSCVPSNICPLSSCGAVTNGIVECAPQAQPGGLL